MRKFAFADAGAISLVILPQRYLILLILNGLYFFVYFHRVSTAVLAPYLIEAFSASATSLGAMSSAYFYPYALSQPMVGWLADRWGAKKIITFSTLISFLGAFLFALAESLIWAAFARALIGCGAAGVFVPALKILLPWFGAKAFARMNTILLAVGNVGAIVASTPYAWFIQQVGWRNSFFFIAGLSLLLFFLSWQFVRDAPEAEIKPGKETINKEPTGPPGFFNILKSPFYWLMAVLFFAYGGPFSTFQGLWGYPFLIDVFAFDKIKASYFLMLIAWGVILGGPILGFLIDKKFFRYKRELLSSLIALQVLNWAALVFIGPSLGYFLLGLILFLMGMFLAGTLSSVWSIVREESSPERLGTTMGMLNPAPFLGIAVFQPLTGYLMDRVGQEGNTFSFSAYQQAFALCLCSLIISLIFSFILPRKRGKR